MSHKLEKSCLCPQNRNKYLIDSFETKGLVFHLGFILSKVRPSSLKESEICCCSAPCFKTVNSSCLFFLTVLATRLGPSPQSSTPCQQTFPCCTAHLVWLVLGAREISLWFLVYSQPAKPGSLCLF